MKYLINYLKKTVLCCLLIVGSISSAFSINIAEMITTMDVVYNSTEKTIDVDIKLKKGTPYIANDLSCGNWEAMDYRFDLYLETGLALDGTIDRDWMTVYDVNDIQWEPTPTTNYSLGQFDQLALPIFQPIPAGYTRAGFGMTIRRNYLGGNDLTDEFITVVTISIPVTGTPTNNTSYIAIRDKTFFSLEDPSPLIRGFGTWFVNRNLTNGEYITPDKSQYPIPVPSPSTCPTTAVWTGATDSDWNKPANWVTTSPAGEIPGSCTEVTIPGGLVRYPVLTSTTGAECNTIHFEMGGEVKGTAFLDYTSASVDLTLEPTRWYMLAAPLRDMYSGDYILSANRLNPAVSMMRYQMDNPQHTSVVKQQGKWSNTFNSLAVPLNNLAGSSAFAVRIAPGTASDPSYTFNFPKSAVSYDYFDADGVQIPGRTDEGISRTASGRFVYEGAQTYNSTTGAITSRIENGGNAAYPNVIIGNPFMSHLNLGALTAANSTQLSGVYRFWTNGQSILETIMFDEYGNPISTEEFLGVVSPVTTSIAPMQSVFAERLASATFTALNFDPSMEEIDATSGGKLRSANTTPDGLLKIKVSRDGIRESGAVIHFREGASNSYVQKEDAKVFFISNFNNKPAVIYSAVDGEALAINTVDNAPQDIALGVSTTVIGELTLDFAGVEQLNKNIELIDLETGNSQDLASNPSYTFENTTGNVEGRLVLRVSPRLVTNQDEEQSVISVYANEGTVHINSNDLITSVTITDIKGQLLYKETSTGVSTLRIPLNIDTQFVLVQVQTEKSKETKKVLVK